MGAAPPWGQSLLRSCLESRIRTSSGLGGALRAPLGPVVAPLVPRCALLPAPTPRVRAVRPRNVGDIDTVDCEPSGLGGAHHTFGMSEVKIGSEGAGSASGEAPSAGGGGGKGGE